MIDINIPPGTDIKLSDCLRGATRQANDELRLMTSRMEQIRDDAEVNLSIGDITVVIGTDDYSGDYEVTPSFETQTLNTRLKMMTDDVTVKAIPVSRTTNPAGGKTIYIGEV